MCCTKLRVEVEQWEDEGVYLVFLLSVKSVPADEVVQEEWEEEETSVDRMGVVTILPFLYLSTPFFPSAPLYSFVTRLMSVKVSRVGRNILRTNIVKMAHTSITVNDMFINN